MLKLGFLGTGWIGLNRMEAMIANGEAMAAAIFDPDPSMLAEAKKRAPLALEPQSFEAMLGLDLDGVVIATPSALHSDQCIQAFDAGKAVFCQKPLGRTATEVEAVLNAARRANRMLGVDLSYRHTAAVGALRSHLKELGRVFCADLTFHNAYGPGAAWFFDPRLSGGGCLIDLGVHLVDLALWLFDFPEVSEARATLLRDGRSPVAGEVEDYALAELKLENGVTVRIACSWNLSAGTDAIIEASLYGSAGGARMRNENGSFFDFSTDLFHGRNAERLVSPPDEWSGRASAEWVRKLAAGERFEGSTTGLLATARALDRLYGRA